MPVPDIQPGEVIVSPLGGGAKATFTQDIGAINSDNDVIHVQVGTLSVPTAGTYRIEVDHESDLPAPQLHFGKRADNAPVLAGGLGLAGFLLVVGLGLLIVIGTRRGRSVRAVDQATLGPEMPRSTPAPDPLVLGASARPLPGRSVVGRPRNRARRRR